MMLGEALRTEWIENPRVGGSIPPPGTTFAKENSGLDFKITRYKCVGQKHTKHTLFAVFWGCVQSGIAVVNTVFVVVTWEHSVARYVANTVLRVCGSNTLLGTLCSRIFGRTGLWTLIS